jgi:hypothetical protein
MNIRIKQLRDLVVALDRADRNLAPMTPEAYREAARRALKMTREEMGLLPIGDFAGPVNSLQTFAENIFFGINGCFADLDGSGRAPVAVPLTRELIDRLSSISITSVDEISNSLFARLRAPNRGTGRRRLAAR